MPRSFANSLRSKLLVVMLGTTLVSLVFALSAMVAYDVETYEDTWTADVTTQAELVGRMSATALTFDDPEVARANLELLSLRPRVQAAAIYTARGALFASYRRAGFDAELPPLPAAEGSALDGRDLVIYRRIIAGDEILGTIYLRTDYEVLARLVDYARIAAIVALAAMLVAFAMSSRLQRVVTGPIMAIAGIAREVVDRSDYSRRATKLSDDEVGMLVDSFNRMLEEIERRTGELRSANIELEREIDDRRNAEQEVLRLNSELESRVQERTAQLETANQELEAFAYSVSHDLRAPLRSVDGFSQALLDDFPEHIPDDARRYLGRIRAATLRMGQLIEDLLNLSRVSRSSLNLVDVDVSRIAHEVVDALAMQEPTRQVDVVIRDGMHARADSQLLRTALENLLGNAWKFTARTDRPRIEVGSMRDGERTVYFVRDNGAGFDMAYADKLFGAFQRLHGVSEYPGTGIGLATVKRIVSRHGGRIWADADVGRGAAFFFTLAYEGEPTERERHA